MTRPLLRLLLVSALGIGSSMSCAEPTAVRVSVFTEIPCEAHPLTIVVGGKSLGELSTRAPASSSVACTPSGGAIARVGDVVLTPADAPEEIAFAVLSRADGQAPDACIASIEPGCIVARRQLRFDRHEVLNVRVDLRLSCAGVACPEEDTCVRGVCVSARLADGACSDGCDEQSLAAEGASAAIRQLAVADYRACALSDQGGVRCWGSGLGLIDRAMTIAGLDAGATSLAAGVSHFCASLGTSVRCWGANDAGQLGDGGTNAASSPVDVRGLPGPVASLAAGERHTCARLTDGRVTCWGANDRGQLGAGGAAAAMAGSIVPLDGRALDLAAGRAHACAVLESGAVVCWGDNETGQLGTGTMDSFGGPIPVNGLSDASRIASRGALTCVVLRDGRVSCWGKLDAEAGAAAAPVEVEGSSNAVEVAVGYNHLCTRLVGGAVACWGANQFGKTGGPTSGGLETPTVVQGLDGIASAIGTGVNHTCARLTDGRVRCWGDNRLGQLGTGTGASPPERATPGDVVGFP